MVALCKESGDRPGDNLALVRGVQLAFRPASASLFFSELPIYTRNIGSSAHTAVVIQAVFTLPVLPE